MGRKSIEEKLIDVGSEKQDVLVSGTNIKTINSQSLLGSGNISISGATLADGDYGDITVGSSGTTMTIDNLAVTNAKINDVDGSKVTQSASYRLVTDTEKSTWNGKLDANTPITGATKTKITYDADGLVTAGADATTADIADSTNKRYVTDADLTKLAGIATGADLSGSNTGDQTSIVGISGTKSQFDTACSDGNFLYVGDQPSLSYASAFATATTTISTATYADITGASVTLAAGTWIIFAHVVGAQPNAIIQMFCAITDGSNNVIAESAQSRPASGTASLNSPMSCSFQAIVTPSGSTTYKLRGARGLTTHTGSWVAYDGSGYNTTNHATNNSDKGTSITAIRIA